MPAAARPLAARACYAALLMQDMIRRYTEETRDRAAARRSVGRANRGACASCGTDQTRRQGGAVSAASRGNRASACYAALRMQDMIRRYTASSTKSDIQDTGYYQLGLKAGRYLSQGGDQDQGTTTWDANQNKWN
jgi:hypothetical protein